MFKCFTLTSMAKVLPKDNAENFYEVNKFSCLRGEKLSFQISCTSDESAKFTLEVNNKQDLNVYKIEFAPTLMAAHDNADDYYISKDPGLYPDILEKYKNQSFTVLKNQFRAFFFEFEAKTSGVKELEISFYNEKKELADSAKVQIEVIDCELLEQDIVCTHWIHTDCLADWYGFEVFSDEYWSTVEKYMLTAVEHGINSLLIPLFTPALDTEVGKERRTVQLVDVKVLGKDKYEFNFDKLKKWLDLSMKSGITDFEFSHFFTQWGAHNAPKVMAEKDGEYVRIFGWETDSTSQEYVAFLESFAKELKKLLKEYNIEKHCYFHVSDEPGVEVLEQYKKCSEIVNRLFGEYKIIDALSSFEFYKQGILKTPIVSVEHISDFIGEAEDLWAYYCCGPVHGYYTNRFFTTPGQRTRILGMQMFKYDIKGFLHWGYNFWYSCLSRRQINPYLVTDGDEAFSAGDPFVVYPGENGEPVASLRLKIFADALQDLRALRVFEKLYGKEKAIEIIDSDTKITFSSYERSERWHFEKREEINALIKKAIDNNLTK